MYNYKSLEAFIEKVNKEAEIAAQKVYDSYQDEFKRRVKAQIKDNDIVCHVMGSTSIYNPVTKRDEIGEKLGDVLGLTQYWRDNTSAGLSLPYKFSKHRDLTYEIEQQIKQFYKDAGVKFTLSAEKELNKMGLVSLYTVHNRFFQGQEVTKEIIKL